MIKSLAGCAINAMWLRLFLWRWQRARVTRIPADALVLEEWRLLHAILNRRTR